MSRGAVNAVILRFLFFHYFIEVQLVEEPVSLHIGRHFRVMVLPSRLRFHILCEVVSLRLIPRPIPTNTLNSLGIATRDSLSQGRRNSHIIESHDWILQTILGSEGLAGGLGMLLWKRYVHRRHLWCRISRNLL